MIAEKVPEERSGDEGEHIDFGEGFLFEDQKYGWGVKFLPHIIGLLGILMLPFFASDLGSGVVKKFASGWIFDVFYLGGCFSGLVLKKIIMGRSGEAFRLVLMLTAVVVGLSLLWNFVKTLV